MQEIFWGNKISNYVACAGIIVFLILIISITKTVIFKRLKKLAKQTATTVDDFLIHISEKTLIPLFYFGAFYVGVRHLTLGAKVLKDIKVVGTVFLTICGILFLAEVITYSLKTHWLKGEKDTAKERSLKGIITVINVIIWGLGIVFLLDNLGFKVSTVVAGLGIGGVAVALAAQAVLGDLFSYFAIILDKPFEIGDFIAIDNYQGTIENIGIKTTRIKSLNGEQLVFANSDLTKSRVRNYKKMEQRRISFKFGLAYQTTTQQLKEIPVIIANIIKNIDGVTFDRAHFSTYGDFSLGFEVVYYVKNNDYNRYMDFQQTINLALKEEFEKRGIEFAYPTQTLYLNREAS
ncbi:MAG: mechanosensitive ion channel family protein [bacterium]|nr:mechanosensitive ion channel family protein [bacterium]